MNKRNKGNGKKHWEITLWLVMAAVFVVSFGSMAAYTNFSSVKKVVSTGKPKDTLFSSNYLYLVNEGDTEYSSRRITPTTAGDNSSFIIQIYNYEYGNPSAWNTEKITYDFTVTVKPRGEGNSLPEGYKNVKVGETAVDEKGVCSLEGEQLSNTSATQKSYTITVPTGIKDLIKLVITATPTETNATNHKKLAAVISMATLEATKNWTGKFLDDKKHIPDEYDAYNYEISGNGTGTVTLTWNAEVLQISKWFAEGKTINDVEGKDGYKQIEITVDTTTAYQLQFYRVPGAAIPGDWQILSGYVTVTFAENDTTQTN